MRCRFASRRSCSVIVSVCRAALESAVRRFPDAEVVGLVVSLEGITACVATDRRRFAQQAGKLCTEILREYEVVGDGG